jgi:hypothetical protein
MNLARCAFCNSPSHTTSNCNSNMKGRREILSNIGRNFMLEDEIPDFNSFPINELRFIASIYDDFQKTPVKHQLKQQLKHHICEYFDSEIMVKYLLSPIQVTITKSRILKELTLRWTMYAPVRLNKNHKKPEDEDCPICLDCLYIPRWEPTNLDWDMVTPKLYSPDALDDGNLLTLCGHTFCGCCWEMHKTANGFIDYEYYRNKLTSPLNETKWIRMAVSCPLCRGKVSYEKNVENKK